MFIKMKTFSILVAFFLAFITTIKAGGGEEDPCDKLKGLKVDKKCLAKLPGQKLPTGSPDSSTEKIEGSVAAMCGAIDCYISISKALGIIPQLDVLLKDLLPGLLDGLPGDILGENNNACANLPDVGEQEDCPYKDVPLSPLSPSHAADTKKSLNVICAATKCLEENGVEVETIPIDPTTGLLNCSSSDKCLPVGIPPLLTAVVQLLCTLLSCVSDLLASLGQGGPGFPLR